MDGQTTMAAGAGAITALIVLSSIILLIVASILYLLIRPVMGSESEVVDKIKDAANDALRNIGKRFGLTDKDLDDAMKEK